VASKEVDRASAAGKSGRRPGKQDTRGAILVAARRVFAAKGFAGASVRAIAADAGVDAALVHHYFDTKQQLFLATVSIPVSIPDLVGEVSARGVDGLGDRLIRKVLQVWESDASPALVAALRTVIADPAMTQAMRQFLTFEVLGRLLATLDIPQPEAERRAGLAVSQLVGVLATRYLVELPAVARQTPEQLIAAIGPVLQRYFDGDFQRSEEQGR
jgi:AcrR family transcriptional regulator